MACASRERPSSVMILPPCKIKSGGSMHRHFKAFSDDLRHFSERVTLGRVSDAFDPGCVKIGAGVLMLASTGTGRAVFHYRAGYKLQKISKEARGRLQACHAARW